MMGVSRVLQSTTPKFIRGGQLTSERRTVSAVLESPVDAVTTVQLASLSAYSRHIFGRKIPQKTYNFPYPSEFLKIQFDDGRHLEQSQKSRYLRIGLTNLYEIWSLMQNGSLNRCDR